jgi:hypothetical protein
MRHLIRQQLLDLSWDAADLEDAAEFWLRLYERANRSAWFPATPCHAVEIRLRGFARPQADAIEAELRERLLSTPFPDPAITRPDPDTVALSSGFVEIDEKPPAGLGVPLLRGEPFDGLLAEVRFTVAGFRGEPEGKGRGASTLVLVGELRRGRLKVKAVWRTGAAGWEDDLQWSAPWTEEAAWLEALEEFRDSGWVPDELAGKLFPGHTADWIARLPVRLIHVSLDGPRLGGLLLRLGIFALVFTLGGWLAAAAVGKERWFLLVVCLLWLLPFVWLFGTFCWSEGRLFFGGHAMFRRGYGRVYAESIRIVPLEEDEALARLGNPWARKYTAELAALGCAHAGDVRLDPERSGEAGVRVFCAPDGATWVLLMVQIATAPDEPVVHQMWPAASVLLAQTFFTDGARLSSVNGPTEGFRRKRTGPESQGRVFVDASDPAEFLQKHADAVREFANETHRTAAPHGTLEEFLRRHEALQEEERRLYADDPFTWGDEWHWYLQIIRREYRG